MFADVCSYDRTDHVDYLETNDRDYDLTLSAHKAEEAANAEYDSDDDPFQWLVHYGTKKTRRAHFKWQLRQSKQVLTAQRNEYKATVDWQSQQRDRRQPVRRQWIRKQWVPKVQLKSNKMELDKVAPAYAYEEWQSRASGPIIPFSVAAAAQPQERGFAIWFLCRCCCCLAW